MTCDLSCANAFRNTRVSTETVVKVYADNGSNEWANHATNVERCIEAICNVQAELTAQDCWRRLGRAHAQILNASETKL